MAVTLVSTGIQFPDSTIQTTAASSALTKSFTSSNQSVPTAASQLFTVAHGLGTIPKLLRVVAVCTTAVNNWAVGDEGEIAINAVDNGNLQLFPWCDSTNVYYTSGSNVLIFNRTNYYSYSLINNSNFAIKVYAFA
jgi:hypothetical protein